MLLFCCYDIKLCKPFKHSFSLNTLIPLCVDIDTLTYTANVSQVTVITYVFT